MSEQDAPNYLLYVVGKDKAGKPKLAPVMVAATGADIQRKKHIATAIEMAADQGFESVSEVFFADAVYSAVEKGIDLQGDTSKICVDLHNEMIDRSRPVSEPPEVNGALWRIAESSLEILDALPPESKVRFIDSLGSNQPSWSRAVYGVFRTDAKGKRYVDKVPVEELGQINHLEKAGMNIDLFLRILAKIGVLDSVLSIIERRVKDLSKTRKKLKLDGITKAVKTTSVAQTSTKSSANQNRGPF